jgi:hypothetical protein
MFYMFNTPDNGLSKPTHVVFFTSNIVVVMDTLHKVKVTEMHQDASLKR